LCAFEAQDLDSVLALYNRNNAARTGTIVRNTEHFEFSKGTWWGVPPQVLVLKDESGQVRAYAVADKTDQAVSVIEIECDGDASFAQMMAVFAEQAIEKRCGHITFRQPSDHAFAEYAQRFGCKWEIDCPKDGGGMMRILNLESVIRKVKPEFKRRIDAARPGQSGSLTIQTDIGAVTFDIDRGELELAFGQQASSVLSLSQDKLVQMLVGYRCARDVLNDPTVQIAGDVLPWLGALFPMGHAYVWRADHF
jgi:hypothetical protein